MITTNSPTVAIRFPVWARHWMSVMPGVLEYLKDRQPWRLRTEDNSYGEMESIQIDQHWDGDGLILFRATEEELANYRQRGQAVVLLSSEGPDGGYPRVLPDNEQGGRVAATHLMDNGFQYYAFLGRGETLYLEEKYAPGYRRYTRERLAGFVDALRKNGHDSMVRLLKGYPLWEQESWKLLQDEVGEFLKSLPKPCGLFVVDDALGAVVMRAAEAHEIRVPEDIAVIGFGDDWWHCMSTLPAMSSVAYPGREIGYLAAQLLDQQFSGQTELSGEHRVRVYDLIKRGSSDVLAWKDALVVQMLEWIREHSGQKPVSVEDICSQFCLSHSTVNQRFRHVLGYGPKKEIQKIRLETLRKHLVESDATLAEIANTMGFLTSHELSRFYMNLTGERPSVYRDRMKSRGFADS